MRPTCRPALCACTIVAGLALTALPAQDKKAPPAKLAPAAAAKTFKTPADLAFDQVLAEPIVRQPISLSFDERGRLWVVQYLQYPHPAGLKVLSRDIFWRVVYDKVPPPPPQPLPRQGPASRFTKTPTATASLTSTPPSSTGSTSSRRASAAAAASGCSIRRTCSSIRPRTTPTGRPAILSSICKASAWRTRTPAPAACTGAQTAGCTAPTAAPSRRNIDAARRQGADRPDDRPAHLALSSREETLRDLRAKAAATPSASRSTAQGRVYSGHNGGDTRGFHYVQGGSYRKGFEKHGVLANPYSFGFFEAMKHNKAQRFSHTFVINEAPGLPAKYRGKLFAVEPLHSRVMLSEIMPDRSSFQTQRHRAGRHAARIPGSAPSTSSRLPTARCSSPTSTKRRSPTSATTTASSTATPAGSIACAAQGREAVRSRSTSARRRPPS